MNTAIFNIHAVKMNIHAHHTASIAENGMFIGLRTNAKARLNFRGRQNAIVSFGSLRGVEMDGEEGDDAGRRELVP